MSTPLTPMLEQYHRIKNENRDAVLMFRMGDFYEMFFDDAMVASRVLEIALTARGRGTGNEAPMCGVPHHAVDSYISRLIASGLKVAVCDQVSEPGPGKGLVRREVVRVVSPGTLADPSALDARDNLYIACLLPEQGKIGAAYIDLSTGDFRVAEITGPDPWEQVAIQLSFFRPREILHPEGMEADTALSAPGVPGTTGVSGLARVSGSAGVPGSAGAVLNPLPVWAFGRDAAFRLMTEQMATLTLAGFGCQEMDLAVRAGGALLHHLRNTQRSSLAHIHRVAVHRTGEHMVLDAATLRTLEVSRSLGTGTRAGSLLSILDRTLTPMGARRIQTWLTSPPLSPATIERRLDAVGELAADGPGRDRVRALLSPIRDIERLLSRATLGTANARDLLSLRASLAPLPGLASVAATFASALLNGRPGPLLSADTDGPPRAFDPLEDLHALLESAIHDEPPVSINEGGLIRDGFDAELDDLRAVSRDGKSYIAGIESRERARTGISTLKVRYNKVFGYYIEVSRSNLPMVPSDYERRQTLVGAERFVTPELKQYEEKVLTAQERMGSLENELFRRVRDKVAGEAVRLKTTTDRLADLDTLASLAEVAVLNAYTRPVITGQTRTSITGGRHPVVEALGTDERFVPNDLTAGGEAPPILIVTGPNMGGKSTYLRQTALITLMAQAGSFVPAGHAEIGIVDRIFSRIGSSDNLAGGQSTFMVEMQETANILNNVTPRSLVLLDEVGRGTSTFDGLSLAWAIVEHLHEAPGGPPRVLFATHYHELTELALTMSGIRNLTVSVKESGQDVVFMRKIIEGAADRSYGIQVARLAGLPRQVIGRAREILANLENDELGRDGMPKLARHGQGGTTKGSGVPGQLPLFGAPADPAETAAAAEIRALDTEHLTPFQALEILHRLRTRLTE